MTDLFINYTTPVLSFFTLVFNIATLPLLAAVLFPKTSFATIIREKVGPHALSLGLVMAIGSVVGSLIYSEIIGFDPCFLCWWERVFIYPQLVIYAIGMYVKEKSVWMYSMVFALLTILVSAYHTYLQLSGVESGLCNAAVISCSKVYFLTYGYITIPTMALSAGVFFFVTALLWKQYKIN